MEALQLSRAALNPDLRLKYFLELISDKSKRTHYEILLATHDNSVFNELVDYEILKSNEKIAKKFRLLKLPRAKSSDTKIHYGLDVKQLPELNYGYLVQKSPLEQRNWACIALCEIINSPDVYKKHSNDIWTIQDQNLICTRFIFFFARGVAHTNLRVDSEPEASSIRELIHVLNNIAC
ncbi:unnamed protein product [Rotaria sp. Silwood2]|nr:unnamed protein product [Rotaria sp. Silwood2]